MPSVLVTGASRGFGRAIAEAYLHRGWTVFPLARSSEVETLAGERCHPIRADVGEAAVEQEISRALSARVTALDLLVNNAGHVKKLRWLPDTAAEDIEGLFRVHCVGAFRCTRAALPFLRASSQPTVVNITSRFGSIARAAEGEFRGIYSYSIAKAALDMLSVCLDQELRKEGIRIRLVHPGRLKTAAGAVDADTDPRVAADKLAECLHSGDLDSGVRILDLLEGGLLPW